MADEDRSHSATPHKLKEARRRGQVAKSTELVSTIVLAVAMTFMCWHGFDMISRQFKFDALLFTQAGRATGELPTLRTLLEFALYSTISVLGPLFGSLMFAGVLANLVQTGPVLSIYPVTPDITRLHPAQAFNRIFSGRSFFELGRTFVKLVLVAWVILESIKSGVRKFFIVGNLSPIGFLHALLDNLSAAGLKIVLVLVIVAVVDLIYSRRSFARKMRMSQREVKDEVRQREGDPRIRSRLRKVRLEMRKRSRGIRNVKQADVLITNPTHLAIALHYEHGKMASPQVIAKGAGVLAAAMRETATRHGVPIVRNPPLARKLYRLVDTEQHVPETLYGEVARIIIWVFAMKQAALRAPAAGAQT